MGPLNGTDLNSGNGNGSRSILAQTLRSPFMGSFSTRHSASKIRSSARWPVVRRQWAQFRKFVYEPFLFLSQRESEVSLSAERRPAKRPSTLISSSRAGQRIPSPSPINSYFSRSSRVPCNRRGNQANGTERVRPSSRFAVIESSENVIDWAKTGLGPRAEKTPHPGPLPEGEGAKRRAGPNWRLEEWDKCSVKCPAEPLVSLSQRARIAGLWKIDFVLHLSHHSVTVTRSRHEEGAQRNDGDRFRAVFHPFIDGFSPFLPFSEKRTGG